MGKSNKIIVVIIFFTIFSLLYSEENKDLIKSVNQRVKLLEQDVNKGLFSMIRFENIISSLEGIPPILNFYYHPETKKIVALFITAGHETWSKSFFYFFDQEENILKYSEEINRPDNPPKLAIIYNSQGGILWSNMEKPVVEPEEILSFYKKILSYQIEFSF